MCPCCTCEPATWAGLPYIIGGNGMTPMDILLKWHGKGLGKEENQWIHGTEEKDLGEDLGLTRHNWHM